MLAVSDHMHSRIHLLKLGRAIASIQSTRLVRFLFSSGMSTAIHWTVMWSLLTVGIPPIGATSTGAVVGSVFNYGFQFLLTFDGVARHEKAIPIYIFTVLLAWVANASFYHCLTSFSDMGVAVAQVSTTIAVGAMNFILYKRIVFHERVN